jgi:hypothetical protein
MAQWYYTVNGQQAGPVDDAQMSAMIQNGQVQPTDLIWREGMASWSEARTVPEFSGGGGAAAAPAGYPQQGYQQPGYAAPVGYAAPYARGTPPKNYLVEAILVTLCCCLPFGVVSIIYAAQVNGKFNAGDQAGAMASAETAKKWAMWGLIAGLISNALVFGLQFAAEASR